MPEVQFHGRVLPPEASVTIGHKPNLHWEEEVLNLRMDVSFDITNSKIMLKMSLNRYDRSLVKDLRMRAIDICRSSVNLVAFNKGFGLTIVIDNMVEPDGKILNINVHNPTLGRIVKSFQLDESFDAIHLIVLQDVHLMLILNDLILGLTATHTAPISCGRVLDGLKNHLSLPGVQDPAAWSALRNAINADERYLKYITDRSKNPRHGQIPVISDTELGESMKRSWTIMDRYLTFRKRGGVNPLPKPEFPLLAG